MVIRWLNPDQACQLRSDPSLTGRTVPCQVDGPCSFTILPNSGDVNVQVNNGRPYLTRNAYGIGISPDAMHFPDPTDNPSFSSYWANCGYSARNSSSYQFVNVPVWRRYVRLRTDSLSSVTRNTLVGYLFGRPRN